MIILYAIYIRRDITLKMTADILRRLSRLLPIVLGILAFLEPVANQALAHVDTHGIAQNNTLHSPRDCIYRGQCTIDDDCASYAYSIHCLDEDIPMFAGNFSTIACCFRCCLQHWMKWFSVSAGRRGPTDMFHWLVHSGGIFLSQDSPAELVQIGDVWDMKHRTRLDKVETLYPLHHSAQNHLMIICITSQLYHSYPFPRYTKYPTLDEAKRTLESTQYAIAAYVSDLPPRTSVSVNDLTLKNDKLVR